MMEFALEFSDLIVCSQNTQCFEYSIKILATGLPVAKTLITYNNNLEKKDEKKKDPINIELIEQKIDPYNY